MRKLFVLLTATLVATPTLAQHGLEAEYFGPFSGPIALADIVISDTLANRASELGERDIELLENALRNDVERELAEANLAGTGGQVLTVVLEDATPNRPTFTQQGQSQRAPVAASLGIGGAKVSATLTTPNGEIIARFRYSYGTPDVRFVIPGIEWADALRTFDRFATRLRASLEQHAAP
jgi:hypothetical protein